MRVSAIFASLAAALTGALLVGCASSTPAGVGNPIPFAASQLVRGTAVSGASLKTPALIGFDSQTGTLEYWPTRPRGSDSPLTLSPSLGIYEGYGMAANGNLVAIANYNPAEVVTYNVGTMASRTLPDPYGSPYDIAIGKHGAFYALHAASVTVFPPTHAPPKELTCSSITNGVAIAVDNESDVFVNGYGPNGFMGVVEYVAGSHTCTKPNLIQELGYAAGIGIDPATDNLIVVDDPDTCAGGLEGRMIVYSKPYGPKTGRKHNLNATYCAGNFRLDATSTRIFFSDSTVSDGFPLIDQRSYPGSRGDGLYQNGSPSSFTTIPNVLPN